MIDTTTQNYAADKLDEAANLIIQQGWFADNPLIYSGQFCECAGTAINRVSPESCEPRFAFAKFLLGEASRMCK